MKFIIDIIRNIGKKGAMSADKNILWTSCVKESRKYFDNDEDRLCAARACFLLHMKFDEHTYGHMTDDEKITYVEENLPWPTK